MFGTGNLKKKSPKKAMKKSTIKTWRSQKKDQWAIPVKIVVEVLITNKVKSQAGPAPLRIFCRGIFNAESISAKYDGGICYRMHDITSKKIIFNN